jgi:hypothetical protein
MPSITFPALGEEPRKSLSARYPVSPSWRRGTLLLVGLSLSVGWGIRGNFGHEYGAAFAGCLAAITVCLLSGREDWRSRVLYFAFFGAIGWGFGGSMSYMQVISYTESGHAPSQWFGYVSLFYMGFLWAALGGAGTAFAAVAEKERLVQIFKPILFVFGAWFLLDLIETPVAHWLQAGIGFDQTWSRHQSPLYWFDADYLAALFALLGAGAYDLFQRREKNSFFLPGFMAAGALAGWLGQMILRQVGLEQPLASLLTYQLGDPGYTHPETGALAFDPDNFLNNWPQWFGDYPDLVGLAIGLVLGTAVYFRIYGKFRSSSSLIVYMAAGWIICFMAFPVLGSLFFTDFGGLRMTPPRADDWAGLTGAFLGMILWMRQNNLLAVAVAAVISGTIGGLGFAGIQWLKQLMMAPGNPRILAAEGFTPGSAQYETIVANWADWQHQNWHSFLEQGYGFVNGLAIAVALGILASRLPIRSIPESIPTRSGSGRWTLVIATLFVLLGITYVNLFKNVRRWSEQLNPDVWQRVVTGPDGLQETTAPLWDVPYVGRLPGVDFLHLTPEGWFNLTWLLFVAASIVLLRRHLSQPLTIVPRTWLGKGQLVFLLLLWVMVIGNFERELVGWTPGRLLTEWVIFLNAIIVTILVLLLPQEKEQGVPATGTAAFKTLFKRVWVIALLAICASSVLFLQTNRLIYQYPSYEKLDKVKYHTRFGPEANWRAKPILKNAMHK